ncbi:receptor-interacting serine/threonine-protein kinase 3 isoform X3 [Xyrauchen texanus]|uniref:receptor-interacting serine/threonine-protein kinase 3 isoform X3 n=1 Tax=Xyrauchen texanus TaxID=154827 RepID=UPI002242C29B|nr:receptor-interacting serine/threonine-protein kinase 3 isoform X3 [Xyrauchen texanus]
MDGLYCLRSDLIRDDCLDGWTVIGSGGFGQIYRAKHKGWGTDVAIKLLLYNDGRSTSSLQREANLMFQGGNPNVLRIFGLYEGRLGGMHNLSQVGLVMEFMSRGSLADLLHALSGPPPWPLTFRITHQIGLGMNFLHQLATPLLHLDLKPNNVLLDDSLNAKASPSLKACFTTLLCNTEAKQLQHRTTYGVLLWSIITGKEPYANALSSLVRFRIPQGDRPDVTSIDHSVAEGLDDIVQLMSACWTHEPNQRPSFRDCVHVTEKVFNMHKRGVNDAVHDVLKQLDDDICSGLRSVQISPKAKNRRPPFISCVTGPSPQQETGANQKAEGRKKDSLSRPVVFVAPHSNRAPQRQSSTPGRVSIHMSNVSAVQIGNNNFMNISPGSRQRHQTAPSSANRSQRL